MNSAPRGASVTAILARQVFQGGAQWFMRFSPILIVAGCWEFLSRMGLVNRAILPSFTQVLAAWLDLFQDKELPVHIVTSLYRALVGLLIGSILGVALGVLMARSNIVRNLMDPLVALTFALPKTAFIPIALLWLGVGDVSTIFVVVLGTLMPMLVNAYAGTRAIPQEFIWSAQGMGASRLHILRSVILPASLVYLTNALRIGLAFSVVIAVSAEMVAANIGIGKFIFLFGESGNYDYMFAAILTLVAIAFLLDRGFVRLARYLLRWADWDTP
jgi:ABC-type nitrate/sulfonate/bicarbonate transport system permease component